MAKSLAAVQVVLHDTSRRATTRIVSSNPREIMTHQRLVVIHAIPLPSARHVGLLFTGSGLWWTSYGVLSLGGYKFLPRRHQRRRNSEVTSPIREALVLRS